MADQKTRDYWRDAKRRQRAGETNPRSKDLNGTVHDLVYGG